MTAAASVTPIRKADRAAIRQHLDMLFRRADAVVPGCTVSLVWSNAALDALNESETFPATPVGLDRAADKAAAMNEQGRNCYVGANPRKPGAGGRGKNADVPVALFHWAEVDDADGEVGLMLWNGATPSATITTGTTPTTRTHVYWELDRPETDLVAWKARQKVLAKAICGDPAVVDESRVLRLAGTINFPKPSKFQKGYKVELVSPVDQSGTIVTPAQLMAGLDYVSATPIVQEESGPKQIGAPELMARDQADLLQTLQAIENDLDYNAWVGMAHAVKAATGDSADGREAFIAWSETYPGCTAESAERVWDSISESKVGADFIYTHASRAGIATSSAAQDFEPLPDDVEPYVAKPAAPAKRFAPVPMRLPENFDPTRIELRKWVLGHRFMVGSVTGGIGAPGVGKSTFSILSGMAIATGRELTGEKVHLKGRVWIHNHEDDTDELLRRIAGVCLHYNLDFADIRDNFLFSSGAVTRLVVAVKQDDSVKLTQTVQDIIDTIKEENIVFLAVDPLVSTHEGVNENSNTEVERVVDAFRKIARETGCAIDLVHHSLKDHSGDTESRAGDMNAARGAGALVGAVRVAYTLAPMSTKGAEDRGISLALANSLARLDMAKGNYSARSRGQPIWYEMKSVGLGNGDDNLGDDLLCETGQESDTVAVHTLYDLNKQMAESAAEEADRAAVRAVGYLEDIVSEFPKGEKLMPQGELAERLLKRWAVKKDKAQERIREVVSDSRDKGEVIEVAGTRFLVYRTSAGNHANSAKYVHCVAVN